MRCGEMMALEWDDIDLGKRQLCVARSEWKGHVTMPKGGRLRYVPLTKRLTEALTAPAPEARAGALHRGAAADPEGGAWASWPGGAARRVRLKPGVHVLRHTFCSHLAMRGAPARAIQELAGHQDLATTQRYMHLSPAALDAAIRLLDGAGETTTAERPPERGELGEAAGKAG